MSEGLGGRFWPWRGRASLFVVGFRGPEMEGLRDGEGGGKGGLTGSDDDEVECLHVGRGRISKFRVEVSTGVKRKTSVAVGGQLR